MTTENGTENKVKTPTLVKTLTEAHKAAGGKLPPKKELEAMKAEWQACAAAKAKASEALIAAQKAESAVVERMVRAAGYRAWEFNGVRYLPSSKGETCFLRREGFTSEAAL